MQEKINKEKEALISFRESIKREAKEEVEIHIGKSR